MCQPLGWHIRGVGGWGVGGVGGCVRGLVGWGEVRLDAEDLSNAEWIDELWGVGRGRVVGLVGACGGWLGEWVKLFGLLREERLLGSQTNGME